MQVLLEREGMLVYREGYEVVKCASDELSRCGLKNSARFMKALSGTGIAPKLISESDAELRMEYIEPDTPPVYMDQYQERLRRNYVKTVFKLRELGIRHGDLDNSNVILREARPVLIDWDQANFTFEDKQQDGPFTDAYLLYKYFPTRVPDTNRIVRRWNAIREHIQYYKGWGTVLDLGCAYGDFTALAQSELFHATGVDNAEMHSDCISVAKDRWEPYGCVFLQDDLLNVPVSHNIVLLLSTWAYSILQQGKQRAVDALYRIIDSCDVLFFETQLHGDGPGPDFLKSDDDVVEMLQEHASNIEPVITLQVLNQPVYRTVWKVSK